MNPLDILVYRDQLEEWAGLSFDAALERFRSRLEKLLRSHRVGQLPLHERMMAKAQVQEYWEHFPIRVECLLGL